MPLEVIISGFLTLLAIFLCYESGILDELYYKYLGNYTRILHKGDEITHVEFAIIMKKYKYFTYDIINNGIQTIITPYSSNIFTYFELSGDGYSRENGVIFIKQKHTLTDIVPVHDNIIFDQIRERSKKVIQLNQKNKIYKVQGTGYIESYSTKIPMKIDGYAIINGKIININLDDELLLSPWVPMEMVPSFMHVHVYFEDMHEIEYNPTLIDTLTFKDGFIEKMKKIVDSWKKGDRLSILLYGDQGLGKSLLSKYLAQYLQMQTIDFDIRDSNVDKYFDLAEQCNGVLFLDDANSVLTKRKNDGQGYEKITTNFLQRIDAHKGIIIATINYIDNIDECFKSRFSIKVNINNEVDNTLSWTKILLEYGILYSENTDFPVLDKRSIVHAIELAKSIYGAPTYENVLEYL